jgi:predicted peroxiredoxin
MMSTDLLDDKKKKPGILRIIILSGEKNIEHALFGLGYALTASTMGYDVMVFFAMEGAALINTDVDDRIIVDKYKSIPAYLDLLEQAGIKLTVCSTCMAGACDTEKETTLDTRSITIPNSLNKPRTLRKGVTIMGIASLFAVSNDANTIVF